MGKAGRKLLFSVVFCCSPATVGAQHARRIAIMVEDAASPWSNPDGTGYANDVVVAAFREMGVAVKLDVVPYARCKSSALSGEIAACVSMTWDPAFTGLIRLASQPLIRLNADVFEPAKKPLPKSASGACKLPAGSTVGTVLDYEYPAEAMALKAQGSTFEAANSDQINLKKLAAARLDAAVVITNDLERKNQKAIEARVEDKVRFAFNCGHETGTIGFSLKHPEGLALFRIYEDGHARITRNGKLKQIEARWEEGRARAARGD